MTFTLSLQTELQYRNLEYKVNRYGKKEETSNLVKTLDTSRSNSCVLLQGPGQTEY